MCADPENMPFSNRKQEGFENKIADARSRRSSGATPSYIWWGQRRGFIRNTMNATLEGRALRRRDRRARRATIWFSTTKPYYRSTYVFVYPKDKGLADQVAGRSRFSRSSRSACTCSATTTRIRRRFTSSRSEASSATWSASDTFYSADNPPSAIIDAVASGKVDVAIVWGPAAGYFVKQQTRAAGDGPGAVGSRRSAVRVRHLDGRQAGQRCVEEVSWRK